jgi:TolA-binding protein
MFDSAIGSFVSGAYARADVELGEFLVSFPADPRCEDAAFLRAVARFRLGDAAGARIAARRYLAAYPAGLRRIEAERILVN